MSQIALCLSGGGFRATLFHLGVLRHLCETGEIRNVSTVTAVSGGAILAAHLAVNWSEYARGGADFDSKAREVIEFAQRDVRGRLVRRWLLAPLLFFVFGRRVAFRRIALLEREYNALYHGCDLSALGPSERSPDKPNFYLLTTSMTTGGVCAFSRLGLERGDVTYKRQILPLALAVASSSAFPPLFPPVVLTRQSLDATANEFPQNYECLSDGGVFDNLGIRWLLQKQLPDIDRIILCDASAPLHWNVESKFNSLLTRTIRATDILMRRVVDLEGQHQQAAMLDSRLVRVDRISIATPVRGEMALHEELQSRIPLIRTDLNEFTEKEVQLLLQHGYSAAAEATAAADGAVATASSQHLFLTHREAGQLKALHKALEGARSNPLGLWNSRDWASYLLWGILLSPVIVVVVLALLAQQQLQLQEQANALLSNRLQAAQAESTDLRKRVSLQTETIERLERELSAPQEPSPSASGVLGSLRAYQLRVGQHVHFISDEPGGLELTLMEGISSCASCSIAPYANPKWGTYFWSDEPGTYVLRLRNLRSVDARVSVGTHEPPSQDMGPTISTFVMRPLEVRSLRIEVREAVRRAPEVQRIPRLR